MDPKEQLYRRFQDSVAALDEQIAGLNSLSQEPLARQEAHDAILAAISRLSNEISDASDYVPAYDQRAYMQSIKELSSRLKTTAAQVAPKTKFRFRPNAGVGRAVARGTGSGSGSDMRLHVGGISADNSGSATGLQAQEGHGNFSTSTAEQQSPARVQDTDYNAIIDSSSSSAHPNFRHRPSFSAARSIFLASHRDIFVSLPPSASAATSGLAKLTNLHGCVIDLSKATSFEPFPKPSSDISQSAGIGHTDRALPGLALQSLRRCVVIAGRVDGPVHVTDIANCVLLVKARQVRMHDCDGVDIYLWCGSRPIVEGCRRMRFAPLPTCWMQKGDEAAANQWDQVDDFKWVKSEHSPNWCELPETERVSEETWRQICEIEEVSRGVDDVLRMAGAADHTEDG